LLLRIFLLTLFSSLKFLSSSFSFCKRENKSGTGGKRRRKIRRGEMGYMKREGKTEEMQIENEKVAEEMG